MYLRKLIVSIAHYYLRITGLILRQPKKNNCITGNLASEARDPGGIRPGNFPDHKFDYLGRAGARVDRGPSGCRDTPCGRARAPGGRRITSCSGPTSARQVRMRRSRVRRMLGEISGWRRRISSSTAIARMPGADFRIGTISRSQTSAKGVRPPSASGISRFPSNELPHMPGSSTTLGRPGARTHAPVRVAFRFRNGVGTRDMNLCEAQWLACVLPYRRFVAALTGDRARLGADVVRYSIIASDLHRLLVTGLPAHCERFWTPLAGVRVVVALSIPWHQKQSKLAPPL
jgi:hypothetical protein